MRFPIAPVARLTLHLNGTLYEVRPVDAQASDVIKAWQLRKADGTTYVVADTTYGATCECASFVFRHDGRDSVGCKHVRACRQLGLIDDNGASPHTWPSWTDTHAFASRS